MGSMDFQSQLLQYIITGITIGGIYSLIALGFNIIYNTTDVINFAQGEFVMLGGMFTVWLDKELGLPLFFTICIAVFLTTICGILLERVAINPARKASLVTLIIITIGASILIKGLSMLFWGKDPFALRPFSGDNPIPILKGLLIFNHGASIQPQSIWVISVTICIMILLSLFYRFTIIGKAMRACAINKNASLIVGIDVNKMVMLSFGMSAMLGAIGGVLITPINFTCFDIGTMLGLKGFCAAIIGGLGSMPGAILGGFSLGIIESLGAGLIKSSYKDAYAFIIILIILFIKPSGLLGKK